MPSVFGVYRGVYTSLVDDPDFQRLTPQARHVLATMRLSRDIGPGCIWRAYLDPIARRTGWSLKIVERSLHELVTMGWIEWDGVILWIKNGLRYDPTFKISDEKHVKAITKHIASLPKREIVVRFCQYYKITCPFDAPSKTLTCLGPPNPNPNPNTKSESDDVGGERPVDGSSPPSAPSYGPGALDPELQKILAGCPNLALVSNGQSSHFWDQVLASCEPYGVCDTAWIGLRVRAWDQWFESHQDRRSKKREMLEARLMRWLVKDLESLSRVAR